MNGLLCYGFDPVDAVEADFHRGAALGCQHEEFFTAASAQVVDAPAGFTCLPIGLLPA